jgi:hypothetical protein
MDKEQQKKLITEIMDADAKDGLYETWEDIEQEYLKDEYPVFGGPFNAMEPFEWLKKYYCSPMRKQDDYKEKSTEPVTDGHKLTAVDWLFDSIQDVTGFTIRKHLYEKAKGMEKDQIMKTWYDCKLSIIDKRPKDALEYYEKTYK